jgi:hypothetical protein
MTTGRARDGRRTWRLGLALALAGASVVVAASPAAAEGMTNRFNLTAQGDAMYYEVNSGNVPGSPNNQAGSLTARAETNSAGNSTAFAGAPYYGPTATTLPGTASGLAGVPVPFTTLPGYVSSRYPAEPAAADEKGHYAVKAESSEFASAASGRNGAPSSVPAPNQQQSADASVVAKPDGTVVSTARAAVAGVTAGPITNMSVRSSASIAENGNRKPTITSDASGRFTVGNEQVVFDRKGFRIAGQNLPGKDGFAAVSGVLANANIEIKAVPESTTLDRVSGATIYTIGALQITTVQAVPNAEPVTVVYVFGRSQVSSVSVPQGDDGETAAPVVAVGDPPPPATSGDGGTSGSSDASALDPSTIVAGTLAPAAGGEPLAPEVAADPAATGEEAAAPVTLGAVQLQGVPLQAQSQLLYMVLVLGGLGMVLGSQLFSRFGVLLQLRESPGTVR